MKKLILIPGLLVLLPAFLPAQVLPAPGSSPPPSNSGGGGSSSGGGGGGGGNGGGQSQQGGIFGGAVPHMDTGSETVTWDGKMWNLNNNRIARSKFEIYLATPEANSADDQAYRDLIAQPFRSMLASATPSPMAFMTSGWRRKR